MSHRTGEYLPNLTNKTFRGILVAGFVFKELFLFNDGARGRLLVPSSGTIFI
jgi:hypothetical protein